jgi:hypothetical protein
VDNEEVLRRIVFVREDQAFPDFKVRHAAEGLALTFVYGACGSGSSAGAGA